MLWGAVLCVLVAYKIAGWWGVILGIVLLPLSYAGAPWYALLAWGDWLPLAVCYGGLIVMSLLRGLGTSLAGPD